MGEWRHNICLACWDKRNADREPHRVVATGERQPIRCCFCGQTNDYEIFVRENPANPALKCGGTHD